VYALVTGIIILYLWPFLFALFNFGLVWYIVIQVRPAPLALALSLAPNPPHPEPYPPSLACFSSMHGLLGRRDGSLKE